MALVVSAICLFSTEEAWGQRCEIFDETMKTLRLSVDGETGRGLPVIRKGTTDHLEVSFDYLTHEYHRFLYRIEHLDANFHPEASLLESDYAQTTADYGLVDDGEQSENTTVLYTHYAFSLPSEYIRPLLSGNYVLNIYLEDEDGTPRLSARCYFFVLEELSSITISATTNTEVDWNSRHQQLTVQAVWPTLSVRNPENEIYLVALQNGRWETAKAGAKASFTGAAGMKWEHCRELIFPAGNEYRKYELQSTRFPGLHIESVRFYDPFYHVQLFTDDVRRNYLYDEDQNGRFVPLANDENSTAAWTAEYAWTHFTLALREDEEPPAGNVSVDGQWLDGSGEKAHARMTYNPADRTFSTALLLKQGYYSYRYENEDEAVEGDFHQTENEYTVLLYYRETGSRYDRLIGYRHASYKPQ